MEVRLIKRFLHKFVGITIEDNDKLFFRKGYLDEISEDSVLLINGQDEAVVSLDRIKEIRSIKNGN